jgi:hypothetical protein
VRQWGLLRWDVHGRGRVLRGRAQCVRPRLLRDAGAVLRWGMLPGWLDLHWGRAVLSGRAGLRWRLQVARHHRKLRRVRERLRGWVHL